MYKFCVSPYFFQLLELAQESFEMTTITFHYYFNQVTRRYFSSTKRREIEQYLERQASDQYSKRAREHSYRARSAFKLLQINEKMNFIRPGLVAIDAGAGSWCQVLSEFIFPAGFTTKREDGAGIIKNNGRDGYILGIDLQTICPIPNVDLLCKANFTRKATQSEIRRRLNGRRVDLLLSDMAPNPSGESYMDHLRIIELCRSLFQFGTACDPEPILAPNAILLCKIFDGIHRSDFIAELKAYFKTETCVKRTTKAVNCGGIHFFEQFGVLKWLLPSCERPPHGQLPLLTAILAILMLILIFFLHTAIWQYNVVTFIVLVLTCGFLLGWALPPVLNRFLSFYRSDQISYSIIAGLTILSLVFCAAYLIHNDYYKHGDNYRIMVGVTICMTVETLMCCMLLSWICFGNYTIVETR
uniref:rRNA methyltransferase 2, mitochondrial n=1 Tax=Globodera rostochiensis TaxID=31243 RepID=A0A914HXQ0_GLORO